MLRCFLTQMLSNHSKYLVCIPMCVFLTCCNMLKFYDANGCLCICLPTEFTVWQQGQSFIDTTFAQTSCQHLRQTHWQQGPCKN